ncbi:MAG: hypothetical protein KDD66_00125 [Bdellovibrionales bacterium]|nr:hypothetical protein [Bdellovibrionales bacterium]
MNRKNLTTLVRFALVAIVAIQAVGCAGIQTTNGSGNRKSLPEWKNEADSARQQVEDGIRTVKNIGDIFG